MLMLDDAKGESEILNWLYIYVEVVDFIGVNCDKARVIKHLTDLGYVKHDNLGEDKEFYQNKTNFARYIIGQIMDCWHPMALTFIESYNKLD